MHSLVKDLMTTQVVTVGPATPFKEIVARLAEHRVSAVPVVDDDGLVLGVVSEADLLLKEEFPDARRRHPAVLDQAAPPGTRPKAAGTTARDLMSVAVVSIAPEATVAEAARRMHAAGVKRLPVLDERGRLVGIVSRGDLLKVFNRPDQAIRREIMDDVIVGEFMMDPEPVLHPRRRRRGRAPGPGRAPQPPPLPAPCCPRRRRGGPGREPAQLRHRRCRAPSCGRWPTARSVRCSPGIIIGAPRYWGPDGVCGPVPALIRWSGPGGSARGTPTRPPASPGSCARRTGRGGTGPAGRRRSGRRPRPRSGGRAPGPG